MAGKSKRRKIIVEGKTYQWSAGTSFVIIRDEEGNQLLKYPMDDRFLSLDDYSFRVTPKHIDKLIREKVI